MSEMPQRQQRADEAELYDVGPVTFQTFFWIFLMSFYVIATGVGLYFAMGNNYITIPQGTFPLR
jgi:Ni,Fe-hydrogenase I cytochrome b subunit